MFDLNDKQLPNDFSESVDAGTPQSYDKDDAASISNRELVSLHFRTEIRKTNVDIVVLLCWFVTGLLDGTIFNGMTVYQHHTFTATRLTPPPAYRTFVSMQTGKLTSQSSPYAF